MLSECEDFIFDFTLYPPEFYARKIDLGRKNQIILNEKTIDQYEAALYFMEHNEVHVNLSIHDQWVLVIGWTYISGKKHPIEIKIKR